MLFSLFVCSGTSELLDVCLSCRGEDARPRTRDRKPCDQTTRSVYISTEAFKHFHVDATMAFGVRGILWDIERAYPRVFYPSGISFLRLLFLSLFSWVRPSTRLFTGFVVAPSPERAKCASFVEIIRVIPATQTSSPFVGAFASTYLTFDVLVFARVLVRSVEASLLLDQRPSSSTSSVGLKPSLKTI